MSLKSFDKFCEMIITSEPGSQKVILDERQRQVNSKLTTEALLIYIFASFANTAVMDRIYKWCDSFLAPMALIAAVCYIYWILRCHFSSALFGINGTAPAKWSAGILMVLSVLWCVPFLFDFADEGGVFHDGMLTAQLVGGISFLLIFIGAAATLVLAKRTEKAEPSDNEKKG